MATSTKPYGQLPANASSSVIPFDLHFPDADLKQMLDLLKLTPIAEPIYENSLPDGDRHLGLRRDWLIEAKRSWETDFDW
jgi:microsomal epoxide hydrolase